MSANANADVSVVDADVDDAPSTESNWLDLFSIISVGSVSDTGSAVSGSVAFSVVCVVVLVTGVRTPDATRPDTDGRAVVVRWATVAASAYCIMPIIVASANTAPIGCSILWQRFSNGCFIYVL